MSLRAQKLQVIAKELVQEGLLSSKDEVSYAVASRKEIQKLINSYTVDDSTGAPANRELALSLGDAVPIMDELLEMAVREKASDIHIEPTGEFLQVRFRIDGVLEHRKVIPYNLHQRVLSRVKILSKLDVAEHRIPQEGRFGKTIDDKDLNFRVASYPTIHGEAAAIRVLSKENLLTLEDMGFSERDREVFKNIAQKPFGIFLVTGPTGSGKTTSLYAALNAIDKSQKHILTVEDPVENEIEGACQTQVNVKAGLTFATVLRSMLRQDPDIIMVGEIRDEETAEIACRAAMTGHLVLSTIHTNTAVGAISRLYDLGLKPYLLSASVIGLMTQRLVRRLCLECREPAPVPQSLLSYLGEHAEGLKNYSSRGCAACRNQGYKGRVGIFEVIPLDDEMRVLINTRAPEVRIHERARALGARTLWEDGLDKVHSGITSLEEVFRVCGETL